jgi:hypothetical protein
LNELASELFTLPTSDFKRKFKVLYHENRDSILADIVMDAHVISGDNV